MASNITYDLSAEEANQLTKLAFQSEKFINSDKTSYPPTLQLHKVLQQLIKSLVWQAPQQQNLLGGIGLEGLGASAFKSNSSVHCSFEDYKELHRLTQLYISRPNSAAQKYNEVIATPLSMLLEDLNSPLETNRNNEIEGLINQLRTRQKELNNEVRKASDSIEQHAQVHLNRLEREFRKSVSELTNGAKTLESDAVQKIQTLSSETQILFQELVNTQKNELSELTAKHIDEAIDEKRQIVFEQLEKSSNRLLGKVVVEVDTLSTRVAEEINEFCRLNEALRKTLKYISSDALADASIAQAAIEKESADKLRIYGVSWLLLSIFLFLTTFDYGALVDKAGVPQYTLIFLRSFFLIVGSAPAFYLLRESARHRTDERRYRQKGIQLATIDGYLAEFAETDRNSVKKELTKHYFHGGDHFVDASSVDSIQATYDKILDRVLGSGQAKKEQ